MLDCTKCLTEICIKWKDRLSVDWTLNYIKCVWKDDFYSSFFFLIFSMHQWEGTEHQKFENSGTMLHCSHHTNINICMRDTGCDFVLLACINLNGPYHDQSCKGISHIAFPWFIWTHESIISFSVTELNFIHLHFKGTFTGAGERASLPVSYMTVVWSVFIGLVSWLVIF